MATVAFTPNLERHVECPARVVDGASVRAVLEAVVAAFGFAVAPDRFAFDLVYRHALALGRGADGGTALAFGSTAGNVVASTDRGATWSVATHHLPPVHAVAFAG